MSSIIKVDTIQNQSGANIISESSNTITVGASGDTITVPSGATLGGAGTVDLSSATVTLNASMKNTPSFSVQKTNTQSVSNASFALVEWNTELYDTDNCFDISTNYRFTPTSSGKYAFHWCMQFGGASSGIHLISLYKNGSRLFDGNHLDNSTATTFINGSAVAEANGTTDYFDIRAYQSSGSSMNIGYSFASYFMGYKLIGA